MRKIFFKFLCVFMAITSMVLCFDVVFAVDDENKIPSVFVDGIVSSDIYKFNEDGSSYSIFPPTAQTIAQAIKRMPENYIHSLLNDHSSRKAIGTALVQGFKEVFSDLGCDSDGNVKSNTGINYNNTLPVYSESERAYYFSYDWRISPYEVASQLNEYINNLKDMTGSEKVNIIAFSMGGAMFMTYLSEYGFDDISSVIMYSSAGMGASVCGMPMSGQFALNSENLVHYLDSFIPEFNYKDIVIDLAKIFHKTYSLQYTIEALESFLMTYQDEIYSEVLVPSFASCPGIWAMCPDDYYILAKEYVFKDKKEEYKNLISLNDKYHYEVQSNVKKLFDRIIDNGGNFAVVSKYNIPITPVMTECDFQSDAVIDTRFTSYGATCAKLNSSLGDEYVQAKYPEINYISPDRVIDASTCLYPDKTWFVRDMVHSDIGNDMLYFFDFIFNSKQQPTIFITQKYPQFMKYDRQSEMITPLESTLTPAYNIGSWRKIIFDLIIHLVTIILEIIH